MWLKRKPVELMEDQGDEHPGPGVSEEEGNRVLGSILVDK